ncbi:MAG: hypothetical protein Q8O34_10695 [Rhodocyclaceae bacterium]|nr:hypothetical protein [Rhodocyclaceae bacterium]
MNFMQFVFANESASTGAISPAAQIGDSMLCRSPFRQRQRGASLRELS